jgi:hypothetical protein
MKQIIRAVYGPANNEGDASLYARLGDLGVTRIERREENLGTYAIVWFDVFKGDHLDASFNALAVAGVYYEEPRAAAEGQRPMRWHSSLDARHLSDEDRAAVLAILEEQGGDQCSGRDIAAAIAEFDKRRASEDRA